MLKKRVTACAFALTLASAAGITGAASASSPPPDDTAAAATADVGGSIVIPDLSGYSMGFAQVGAESGWRTANTQSIQDAAAEAGIDLKFTDAQGEQESQIESIRQFIQQGVDIIAFSPVVETGWDAALVEARDAGIPVVLTDRAIESDEEGLYVTFLGSDFIREGVWAGDWVNENFADADHVNWVELQGTTGSAPANDRAEGFRSVVTDPKFELLDSQTGDFTRAGGKQVMEAFLQAHDDIDLVFAHNDDMGLGAIEAIEAAGLVPGEDIQIVTIDAVHDGMQALADGKINYIVECNPLLGPQLMDIAGRVLERRRGAGPDRHQRDHVHPGAGRRGPPRPSVLIPSTSPRPGACGHPAEARSLRRCGTPSTMTTDMPDTEPPTEAIQPTVQMRDITVSFPGVLALDGVSLRLFPGEVHALLGENGAGKSTLVKALTGVHRIDRGEVLLMGQPLEVHSPGQAQLAGISTVYQEVNLAANLSVAENTMLGREPRRRFGRIDWPAMRRRTTEVLEKLHLDIDPASPLESHSIAVQQLVSIARAMEVDARVLILDEPTSSLDTREVDELFEVVERVRASGVAVVFITHFLDQVYRIANRITVLRNGRLVGEYLPAELPRLELVSKMIGRELAVLDALEHEVQDTTDAADAPDVPAGHRARPQGERRPARPRDARR